jgi:hypothetical protein
VPTQPAGVVLPDTGNGGGTNGSAGALATMLLGLGAAGLAAFAGGLRIRRTH